MKQMVKTLYLVRHAKASRAETSLKDWERPLLEVGVERANKISAFLKKKKICPDKIISSHALRALNTAVLFSLNLNYPVNKIEINSNIYSKSLETLLGLIQKQSDNISSLMLFGHNPYITDLYNFLCREEINHLSTSAVACIEFKTDNWSKIQTENGISIFVETGK